MITWEQVVDASDIQGPTPTEEGIYEADFRVGRNGGGGGFGTQTYSNNWFEGIYKNTAILDDDYEPFEISAVGDIFEGGLTVTYVFGASHYVDQGSSTSSWKALTGTQGEGESPDLNPAGFFVSTDENDDWSSQTITLRTYELFTQSNLLGTTTTLSQKAITFLTTVPSADEATTIVSADNVNFTNTVQVNDSTKATWRSISYETTYFTGETTAGFFYSSFSHDIPLVKSNDTLTTQESASGKFSFISYEGFVGEPSQSVASVLAETSGYMATATTLDQGSIVLTFVDGPRVTGGGFKIVETQRQESSIEEKEQNFTYYRTTTTEEVLESTKQMAYAGAAHNVRYALTFTFDTENGLTFESTNTFVETTGSGTSSGFYGIDVLDRFATSRSAQASVAHSITVGVRAFSNEQAGLSIEAEGQGNNYLRNTSSGVLAATRTAIGSTWSANSYTFLVDGQQETGTFKNVGEGPTQWVTAAGATLNLATIVGGHLAGNAVINAGQYISFADNSGDSTVLQEPLAVQWESDAPTTAWRQEGVATLSRNFDAPVNVTSRHPVTVVIDD
jgi:hypothetical protein